MEERKTPSLAKKTDCAFGKKVYLLGKDKDGYYVWLEAPRWALGWYWGFGYIERYLDNKKPSNAVDIDSHMHWNSEIIGADKKKTEKLNCSTMKRETQTEYCYHINENADFIMTTLTDRESWELSELMQSFYDLKKAAEVLGRGGSNVTKNLAADSIKNEDMAEKINQEILPALFEKIDQLLSPKQ